MGPSPCPALVPVMLLPLLLQLWVRAPVTTPPPPTPALLVRSRGSSPWAVSAAPSGRLRSLSPCWCARRPWTPSSLAP